MGNEQVSRRQLLDALEGRPGGQRVPEAEALAERDRIQHRAQPGDLQERLRLRAEDQDPVLDRVVDRPDAHPVSRQHKPVPLPVPEGEGEVSVEVLDAARPLPPVRLEYDLGVGARPEAVSG